MWLDDLTPEGELATQRQRLETTSDMPEPTFWQGALSPIGPGFGRGLLRAATMAESGFSSLWQGGLNLAASALLPEPRFGGDVDVTSAERISQEILGRGTAEEAMELRPDPRTTGLVGQLLGEAAAILPVAAAGAAFGGIPGMVAAAGAPAGYEAKQVAMAEGIDEDTAAIQGAIEGVTVGIGAALPAARFVKPLAGDLAIAVGANVGLGVVSRGSTAELLEQRGYEAQAAQYRAFDSTAMTIDAVLGAAFFGIGRSLGSRPAEHQVDAALTENNAQHAELGTAPGIPVDAQAANTHVRALDIATEQLARGEPVRLPDDMPEAAFLRSERERGPVSDELGRVREEQTQVDARVAGDDFAARVGRASAYDEAGAPIFTDGTAYPLREVVRFFEQHVEPTQPKDGAKMPDVLFQIGEVSEQVAQALRRYLPGFHDGLREARISGRSIKHIQDSRPGIARDVLGRLEAGVLRADEVLPNPQDPKRALVVLRDVSGDKPSNKKHQSTVLEVSANGKGIDVVSAMTMPDRTLNKARALKQEMDASDSGGPPSPSSLGARGSESNGPHAAAAPEGFLTVEPDAGSSIRPATADATDPEVRLAQAVLDEVGDIQVPTGAIDADGNPVTVSARQLLAEADADIQRAQLEARGIEAAAVCFRQRGIS